jgi:RsiW-degrading membrane proteinase PrsW (M82 family)
MAQPGLSEVLLSFTPVTAFLLGLNALDTYRLLTLRRVVAGVLAGSLAALSCYWLNTWGFQQWGPRFAVWGAPAVEELAKAAYVLYCVFRSRVGFPVDAAVTGFAVGTGFALVENLVYMNQLGESTEMLWLVRGVGTATMHGGATAIVGIAAVAVAARSRWLAACSPVLGYVVHAAYNSGALPPLERTALVVATLPVLLMIAFQQSERMLGGWLHGKMDSDLETLSMMDSGSFLDSPAGAYLASLRDSFRPEVVTDMFCFLRLSAELSAKAKAELLQRELGFAPPDDPERAALVREMAHLERGIGAAGRRALAPLMPADARDRWERLRMQ